MSRTILIVDDEESIRKILDRYFSSRGYTVFTAADGASAIELCQSTPVDLALLDLHLPDMNGLDVLQALKGDCPSMGVIIVTAHGDVETAVRAMHLKADNFVQKPIDLKALEVMVEKTLENYRTQAEVQYLKKKVSRLEGGANLETLRQPPEIFHAIHLLAENPSTTVLILGPTGTGKGTVAGIIHELSNRRALPMVDVNCAGLSSEFLESELFGHEKGAFTDAKTFKRGLLEVANGGGVFFDEIGEMSLPVQAKLLKVMEGKTFRRLGGTINVQVDVRIMAATNLDLAAAVKAGRFREDLYFRLNVMPLTLPNLQQRRDDIMPLAHQFLDEFRKSFGKEVEGFDPRVEPMLLAYPWPGNIRELRNVIERAVLLATEPTILPVQLPENLKTAAASPAGAEGEDWDLETIEKKHLQKVLAACGQNRSRAATILGIHRSTLINKIQKYGL